MCQSARAPPWPLSTSTQTPIPPSSPFRYWLRVFTPDQPQAVTHSHNMHICSVADQIQEQVAYSLRLYVYQRAIGCQGGGELHSEYSRALESTAAHQCETGADECRTCSWAWMACHLCSGTRTALWAATRATLWLRTSRHMASECFSPVLLASSEASMPKDEHITCRWSS